MKQMRFLFVIALITSLAINIGCSGSGNPVTPGQDTGTIDSIPVIGLSSAGDILTAIGTLGIYELQIDPDSLTADLVSKRTSTAIGDSNLVSGLPFFTMSIFCKDCLKHTGIRLTADGDAELTFELTHPFEPGSTSLPPTAGNRLDLDLFDVALVIVPLETTPTSYITTSIYDKACVNASGYTKELTNVISDTAALPYFLVVDDSIDATPPVATYNKFPMGGSSEFDVIFDLSGSSLKFDLYLTMGYGAAASGKDKPTFLAPTYFNPEYNRKNAWKVEVTSPTEPWKENENSPTDTRNVTVKVYDWQTGATVSSDWPNETVHTNIYEVSEVTLVSVEVLGVTGTVTSAASGAGTPDNPLMFDIPIANTGAFTEGFYTGVVKVTDSRTVGTSITDPNDNIIDTEDAITLTPYLLHEFATYQTFTAEVITGTTQVICDIHLSTENAGSGETIYADPGTSSAPDGLIQSYEYDFDFDGTFVPDEIQNYGDADYGDPVAVTLPCNTTGNPLDYPIALRVCNDSSPALCSECSDTVTIGAVLGDPGDLTVVVNRGEGGANQYLITSIDLNWAANPCAVEYSIERSNIGWDLTGIIWSQIDTSTSNTYKYVLTGNDWDEDYRFRVISRAVSGGDPGSDSSPSEEVFVWFQSNRGINASPSNELIGISQSGSSLESVTSGGGGPMIDDWMDTSWGFWCLVGNGTNEWAVARSPQRIPDLEGQSEAWCDYYIRDIWSTAESTTSGFTVGTLSAIPSPTSTTLPDYDPSNDVFGSCTPYNIPNVEGLNNEFGETNQAGWQLPYWTEQHHGYYLNDLLDDGNRDWFAFGIANGSVPTVAFSVLYCMDAWVLVVQ